MKRIIKTVVLLCLLCSLALPVYAADPWDRTDIALGATAGALKIVDRLQTGYIAGHPDQFYEVNPLLSRHPSEQDVNLYFIGSALVQGVVAHYLSSRWRKIWLAGWIGLSGSNVMFNSRAGIGLQW